MLRASRELALREKAQVLSELVAIAATPSQDKKYAENLVNYYEDLADRAVPELQREKSPGVSSNGRAVLDWKTASDLMIAQLAVKKRLEYGGRKNH